MKKTRWCWWWNIKQNRNKLNCVVGCNRSKSPNSAVHLKFMSQFDGDVHGSRPMDVVSHLTVEEQKPGQEKRVFRNRHQTTGLYFTITIGFQSLRDHLIESTTHDMKRLKNGRRPLLIYIFFTTSSLQRPAVVLQVVSSTCQDFPISTIHLHLQKKVPTEISEESQHPNLEALPRKCCQL